MKSKVIRILFASILMMNLSCTTDDLDNQDFNSSEKKKLNNQISKDETVNSKTIDSLKISYNLQVSAPDGDPLNPKIK
ncbi:hypothetical protein DBB36_23365 [Flavobacterium sp. WLB]|uniref:Uncharacterized protein n=1 Tax=Flavobacterium panici TaxID=2654843 RepID=A0A9N8P1R9_9FLAO|nr:MULTISPECIES: hypothetical protein [Flavobacterium]KOP37530.1 hypothetical protein AKO67_14925 [Flavobacterium sp. VMW]OWU92359.1 hypothetical protein APR43_03720 [Flavobacterium sp. NLM]PUU67555.1 hypothetical protein DBB36_23365 [Flavobacterium sp. WLB]UUF13505.1 hypothetical protein NLJ00_19820 [Flavobacterium panici]CAC9974329.1 hypothetical protein FLAPXU55_02026 [Flavobacterium panici]